jgi:hypothetical protein
MQTFNEYKETTAHRCDDITPELIQETRKWLGSDGINLFKGWKTEHGTVSPVLEGGPPFNIPHAVHFNEGMQVRNFLRTLDECGDWTGCEMDNTWMAIVEAAIEE